MRQTDRSGKARWGGLLTISFIMVMMLMLAFPMGRAFAARTDTITLWRGESYKMNLWPKDHMEFEEPQDRDCGPQRYG